MLVSRKKIIVFSECASCTDNKMSISVGKHAGMSNLFGNSPHPRFVYFALRVKKSGCLRYKSFSYLIFKLTSFAFLFDIFLCVRAIFAQPFVLKLTYANCENLTSTVITQFTLEIKN